MINSSNQVNGPAAPSKNFMVFRKSLVNFPDYAILSLFPKMPLIDERGPRTIQAKGYFPSKNCKFSIRSLFLTQELSLDPRAPVMGRGQTLEPLSRGSENQQNQSPQYNQKLELNFQRPLAA